MANLYTAIYSFTLSLYMLASLLYYLDFKGDAEGKRLLYYAGLSLKGAFAGLSMLMLVRFFAYRYFPAYTFYETLLLLTFSGSLILIILQACHHRYQRILFFTLPLITFFLLLAGFFPWEGVELLPELQSFWPFMHIFTIMGAYAIMSVAFMASLMYLLIDYLLKKKARIQFLERMPSLHTLDNLNYILVIAGFSMLTLSFMLGAFWADRVWGSMWDWEPRQTFALITWLVYATYLYFRIISGWRGKSISLLNIAGFMTIIFNYFIIRFIFSSNLHVFF